MSTGQVKKYQRSKGYESLPREMLQDSNLSLEAIGLLSYMQSLPVNFKLYKTYLYKQFPKNKRTSIDRIWKELTENKYLLSFRKRSGKKWNYNYIFSVAPFTQEEIDTMIEEQEKENFSSVDFQQLKMSSSKPTSKGFITKEINYQKDTLLDTEQEQAPDVDLDKLSQEIDNEIQNPKSDSIPKEAKETLKTFGQCFTSNTYELIGIALRAKKESSTQSERALLFEQFEEEFIKTTKIICNHIYKSKKGETKKLVENPEAFLYWSYINYFNDQAFKLEQIEEMESYPDIPMFSY